MSQCCKDENIAVSICGLEKRYGGKKALSDATFYVKKGEVMGFLGPNGAGKSTTMNILTGYISPTSGTAFVGGVDIMQQPSAVKRKIGYLPENPPLYQDMTVIEYLEFVYKLKKVRMDKERHIEDVMQLVRIMHRIFQGTA